ncbi:MAG: hypothetical protein ACFE95_01105 [Candidatus Hodarchaeota archaeon]
MASEDLNDFSSVTSSIFYAKKNSISKQNQLLSFSLKKPVEVSPVQIKNQVKFSSSQNIELKNTFQQKNSRRLKKPLLYRTRPLSTFYPEIPDNSKQKKSSKKNSEIRKKSKTPLTKELLSFALEEKKQTLMKKSNQKTKRNKVSKKKSVKEKKGMEGWLILRLTQFITEEKVKANKISSSKSSVRSDVNANIIPSEFIQKNEPQSFEEPLLADIDPFPFTSLAEWLLWHRNYPEYSHVREAFDYDQVPEDSDIEVFWVNTMNEPEFFSPNWKIAGIRIDNINKIEFQGRPEGMPEWQILPSETDGLSNFFEDVFRILIQNPQGIRNYTYSIIQFALKGLNYLNLAHFDDKYERWFNRGGFQDLNIRLRVLDQFISSQTTIEDYQRGLELLLSQQDSWILGVICFDLISSQSAFLKYLSNHQTSLSEDNKIRVINKSASRTRLIEKLTDLMTLDRDRVKSLLDQLNPN